jgi:hypothetical protein
MYGKSCGVGDMVAVCVPVDVSVNVRVDVYDEVCDGLGKGVPVMVQV